VYVSFDRRCYELRPPENISNFLLDLFIRLFFCLIFYAKAVCLFLLILVSIPSNLFTVEM